MGLMFEGNVGAEDIGVINRPMVETRERAFFIPSGAARPPALTFLRGTSGTSHCPQNLQANSNGWTGSEPDF